MRVSVAIARSTLGRRVFFPSRQSRVDKQAAVPCQPSAETTRRDVDLSQRIITAGKFRKDRLVPPFLPLVNRLQKYAAYFKSARPMQSSSRDRIEELMWRMDIQGQLANRSFRIPLASIPASNGRKVRSRPPIASTAAPFPRKSTKLK